MVHAARAGFKAIEPTSEGPVGGSMYRRIRTAAFAVVIAVLLSGLALAQRRDDDDNNDSNNHKDRQHESKRDHDQDRDHDRDDHDVRRGKSDPPGWSHGRKTGWGDHDVPPGQDKDRDRDDHRWHDRDDRDGNWRNQGAYRNDGNNYPYSRGGQGGYGNNPGYSQGYQDGSRVGQSDMAHGKPFNSYPRGAYRTSDHGYHSGYGNKGAYQQSYLRGYETAYRSSYRRASGRY
jgi:hypothetical protein